MINLNPYIKRFTDILFDLGGKHGRRQIFKDFLQLAICTYHSINIQSSLSMKDENNESLYMDIIKNYDRNEIDSFSELISIFVNSAYDHNYSDILGHIFMENFSDKKMGQVFTPSSICKLMGMICVPDVITDKSFYDPSAGSGRTMLDIAKDHPNNYFYCTDIDEMCAKMCTLNFFINGMKGMVVCGDELRIDHKKAWSINMNGVGILPIKLTKRDQINTKNHINIKKTPMSKNKRKIINEMKNRGFTGNIELFYWANDGWYCQCDQLSHIHIGYNIKDVMRQLKNGEHDRYLKDPN